MATFQVLVIDDHKAWRHFVIKVLDGLEGMLIIGEAADGLSGVQQAKRLRPDLITLDISLPHLNGIRAAKQIRVDSPHSKILCVSENRSLDIATEVLTVGASGYVVKSDAGSELLPAVKAVLSGKQFISSSLADLVVAPHHL